MLTKTEKLFSILFVFIVLAELISGSLESLSQLHYIAKPAIVISLITYVVFKGTIENATIKRLTISALVLSVIGDILLMFVDNSPHFFTAGLAAFLLAHVVYIITFLKHRNTKRSIIAFAAILLVYAALLFYLIKDNLGAMLIPVILYMLVILSMAVSAYKRKGNVSTLSYNLVFIGALCFMLSDSLLALNKFYNPLPLSNISIMLTYASAQYLIVFGIIKNKTS
ncbi:lysoplasmalogenase family protein [Winogradskyella sp. 3972H.M.0a.05]|uniref:lysoplasmalogenase n=1 Tax=Winogradskyella sp. 3972H.M.0a.05 TaxID=2950277 RepID=UPI0033998F98